MKARFDQASAAVVTPFTVAGTRRLSTAASREVTPQPADHEEFERIIDGG